MIIETKKHNKFEALCICAIRYCIGRRTYMVNTITNYVAEFISEMSDNSIKALKNDVEKYIQNNFDLCDMCDENDWYEFLGEVKAEYNKRKENKK